MSEAKQEKKKRTKRTVTLYTEDGHFECPVIFKITPKVHDAVTPILEQFEEELAEPVPETIRKMQELQGQEREDFVNANAAEIGQYTQRIVGALSRLKGGDTAAGPRQIKATRKYILRMLRVILDTEKVEKEEYREMIESEIDSDFWMNQDLEEGADHVARFRRRLA